MQTEEEEETSGDEQKRRLENGRVVFCEGKKKNLNFLAFSRHKAPLRNTMCVFIWTDFDKTHNCGRDDEKWSPQLFTKVANLVIFYRY